MMVPVARMDGAQLQCFVEQTSYMVCPIVEGGRIPWEGGVEFMDWEEGRNIETREFTERRDYLKKELGEGYENGLKLRGSLNGREIGGVVEGEGGVCDFI